MPPFIWETHGIHVGTGEDHVSHGVDCVDSIVERAISLGFPSVTILIHSPRLTRFRYSAERDTNVKFIRGYRSYHEFSSTVKGLEERYRDRIIIKRGVELEWLGSGLGEAWGRSAVLQARDIDFVIGSVHFSREGIAYDDCPEETERLITLRGGLEPFWQEYLDELIEMVDSWWEVINVVGHLDLPKLYAPLPPSWQDLAHASDGVSRRLFTLLQMIADRGLTLDVNVAGLRRGRGVFPGSPLLALAKTMGIPAALGTDCHDIEKVGQGYAEAQEAAEGAGFRYYVSFSKGIHEKRPFSHAEAHHFTILNTGVRILNMRLAKTRRGKTPVMGFGGGFRSMLRYFPDADSMGESNVLALRADRRSIALSDQPPDIAARAGAYLFSHHADIPGTLVLLLNTLASEGINVETAHLHPRDDGTATAHLTLGSEAQRIEEAIEFVLGTAPERFQRIEFSASRTPPPLRRAPVYLAEVDGVVLPLPVSGHMIVSVHNNRPGVLLILLSALAAREVNVTDLQLGARGDKGYAVLGVVGNPADVEAALVELSPQFLEVSHIVLPDP